MKKILIGLTLLSSTMAFAGQNGKYWDMQIQKARDAAMASYANGERQVLSPLQEARISLSAQLIFCTDVNMQSESCREAIRSAMAAGISDSEIESTLKSHIKRLQRREVSDESVDAMIQKVTR